MNSRPVRHADPSPRESPPTPTPGLRRYLYFTAAATGAAVMVVEILGAKMLAPYLGTSHFVWTAQIAVTLIALAAGYYLGGRLADRSAGPGRVYAAVLAAAVYLCFTVLVVEPVAYWCLEFRLAVGSLLASAFLFLVPLALLAVTGPVFVRALTAAAAGAGGVAGRLSAVGTAGSFGGTLLIGYVLIPFFRNSVTMYLTAGGLMVVAAGYFLVWGRSDNAGRMVAAGVLVGLAAGAAGVSRDGRTRFGADTQLYRANSNFGQLQVLVAGEDGRRFYLNDFLTQNTYDPVARQSTSMFTYLLAGLSRAYAPRLDDVLCIGLGVGIVPMELARGGARVDAVEINPAVVPLAVRYFDFDPAKVNVVVGDGRQYLNATARRYDAVVLDAFLGDSSPSHLMSREAFAAVRRVLRPGGVLVINSFCKFEPGSDFFGASLDKTLRSVFPAVRAHAAGDGNTFFVASDDPDLKARRGMDFETVHPICRDRARDVFEGSVKFDPAAGIVLTDDYNPAEFYDAANRESYRLAMALSMRQRSGS